MLRTKLLARLGLLVAGFVVGAVVSIALLQGVLKELDTANLRGERMLENVQRAMSASLDIQALVHDASSPTDLAGVSSRANDATRALEAVLSEPAIATSPGPMTDALQRSRTLSLSLSESSGRPIENRPAPEALRATAVDLRDELTSLGALARHQVAADQAALSSHLRTLIIGLTIAALVMTNIAVFVLVRTANMILRPVGQLLEGSRQLAQEHFDYRITDAPEGEFGELAGAYNTLANELAANEQKKVKALQQLAVTLNHELNNVINAIELQLRLVIRKAGADPQVSTHMAGIHTNLERMTKTIASLRDVRRVVLTDYAPGQPMLDLPKCTAADDLSVSVRPSSITPPSTRV